MYSYTFYSQPFSGANSLIAETLELLHTCFPWWDKEGNKEGQGWAVSKFHGGTNFFLYIKHFGDAINFYSGIGECNHKKFVKETGCNTRKRIRTSTSQVAQRYYEGMTLDIARKAMDLQTNFNENDHELSHQEYNEEKALPSLVDINSLLSIWMNLVNSEIILSVAERIRHYQYHSFADYHFFVR
jgi:hypothetical protein